MKWIEVEALTYITKAKVCDIIWKSIICRFELSWAIIMDNGY